MILVTGGLGFIGAHTSRALLDLGEGCVIAGRNPGRPPRFLLPYLGGRAVVERLDCTDLAALLAAGERHKITGIVHLAAAGLGGGPLAELQANAQALFNVLHAAQEWGVTRVVQASTIGVYAGTTVSTYREDAPLPISSPHAIPAFKKSAEILADAVADGTGMDIISVRIGAVWGPLGPETSPFLGAPQLVHAAVHCAVHCAGNCAGNSAGHGHEDGPGPYAEDAIDMCYVRDCGRAIALLQTAKALNHRTYNIGGGRAVTNREVAEAITRAVPEADPVLTEGRGPHAPAEPVHLDLGRLRADTGFEPGHDLDRGVKEYVRWLRDGHSR